jgi:hypothetical protein
MVFILCPAGTVSESFLEPVLFLLTQKAFNLNPTNPNEKYIRNLE